MKYGRIVKEFATFVHNIIKIVTMWTSQSSKVTKTANQSAAYRNTSLIGLVIYYHCQIFYYIHSNMVL